MNNQWKNLQQKASIWSLSGAVVAMPFSITLCHACLIAFFCLWLSETDWPKKLAIIKSDSQLLVLFAFVLMLLLGIIYSDNRTEAWFVLEKKLFFFLIPVALATSSIKSQELQQLLLRLFCATCVIALLICYGVCLRQWILFDSGQIGSEGVNYLSSSEVWNTQTPKAWLFFSYVSLASAIGMHPTYLGLYCAFCCIILIKEHQQAKQRMYKIMILAALAFFSVSIIFLSSRIVIVLLAAVCLFVLIYRYSTADRKLKTSFVLAALIGILVLGVTFNPVTRYRQVDEILATGLSVEPGTRYTNSTGIRASLWWLSAKAYFESNPIIGTGIGDVEDSIRTMGERYQITNVLNSYNSHSQYLFFLLSSGMVGLLLFISYLAIGFMRAIRARNIIALSFLFLFSAVCATENVLELQKGIVFFAVFFPILSVSRIDERIISPSPNFSNAAR